MYKLYLFHAEDYVGYFDVYNPFDLVYHDVDLYRRYGLFPPNLKTKEGINTWLYDRIIPDERPDKSLALAMAGFKPGTTDWEVLVKGHCTTIQDTLWWSTEKDPSWYNKHHWYPCLQKHLREYYNTQLCELPFEEIQKLKK